MAVNRVHSSKLSFPSKYIQASLMAKPMAKLVNSETTSKDSITFSFSCCVDMKFAKILLSLSELKMSICLCIAAETAETFVFVFSLIGKENCNVKYTTQSLRTLQQQEEMLLANLIMKFIAADL